MKTQLGRRDWVRAALKALAAGGVQKVQVEPLARALGVTKGSFYWHYTDRRALLAALLEDWEQAATLSVIDRVEEHSGTPDERLWRLTEIAIRERYAAGELAIRAWADTDESAAEAVRRVDGKRLAYLQGLFREMGFDEETAAARSRLVYCALIGEPALSLEASRADRLALAARNHTMLIRR
jgi:AcrR family transcriptional regulator